MSMSSMLLVPSIPEKIISWSFHLVAAQCCINECLKSLNCIYRQVYTSFVNVYNFEPKLDSLIPSQSIFHILLFLFGLKDICVDACSCFDVKAWLDPGPDTHGFLTQPEVKFHICSWLKHNEKKNIHFFSISTSPSHADSIKAMKNNICHIHLSRKAVIMSCFTIPFVCCGKLS